jgi:leucyl/phenylalanyl-tRNA--protein transferase
MTPDWDYDFPDPTLAPPEIDLVAISAFDSVGIPLEINPNIEWPKLTNFGSTWHSEVLITAYEHGLFPMPYEIDGQDSAIGWWSPAERAIFYPGQINISTSLKRSMKKFSITMNRDFRAVISACADPRREGSWINHDVIEAFCKLHEQGLAHSIEVRDSKDKLVGGLYGIELGGVFAGESMFHFETDASKAALVYLAKSLDDGSGRIIDTQWMTDHLSSLGAKAISRAEYCANLPTLLGLAPKFSSAG